MSLATTSPAQADPWAGRRCLTVEEYARTLALTKGALWVQVRSGNLVATSVGGAVRIFREDADAFEAGLTRRSAPAGRRGVKAS